MFIAFRSLGYTSTLVLDASGTGLYEAVDRFVETISPGDTTVVYYSGHGLQVAGENYLVPTDFRARTAGDVGNQGYPLSSLLKALILHGSITQVIILDACRDNPFLGQRSTGSGWATVSASSGTFLAFGTAPGATASDNPLEDHGLFTKSVLKYIGQPLEIDQLFQRVREQVVLESGGVQVPWTASSLIGSLALSVPPTTKGAALSQRMSEVGITLQTLGRAVSTAGGDVSPLSTTRTVSDLELALNQAKGLRLSEALNTVEGVLALDPRSSQAMRLLGLILHLLGRTAEARRALDVALLDSPNDAMALSYRCLIMQSEDVLSAERDCRSALQIRNDMVYAQLGLALSLQHEGRSQESLEEADSIVNLHPSMPLAHVTRAEIEVMQHHDDLAREDLITANKLAAGTVKAD